MAKNGLHLCIRWLSLEWEPKKRKLNSEILLALKNGTFLSHKIEKLILTTASSPVSSLPAFVTAKFY